MALSEPLHVEVPCLQICNGIGHSWTNLTGGFNPPQVLSRHTPLLKTEDPDRFFAAQGCSWTCSQRSAWWQLVGRFSRLGLADRLRYCEARPACADGSWAWDRQKPKRPAVTTTFAPELVLDSFPS